jgi:hypothetical protein
MNGNKDVGATREICPDDAFLIFEKWHSEKAPVYCNGSFFGCAFNLLRGEMTSVSRDEVSMGSPDGQTVITLRLDCEDLIFRYGEPKDSPFPVPKGAEEVSVLIIGLPLRVLPSLIVEGELTGVPLREKLFFMELPRELTADPE